MFGRKKIDAYKLGHLESTKIQIHETKKELSRVGGEWTDRETLHKPSDETIAAVCVNGAPS